MFALHLAAPAATIVPSLAQDDVAGFYRGRQIRILIGSTAGGGYDLFARIVARHLAEHIPGHPTIIVQNLPAAGGMVMTNQLSNLGPKDGTVIGVPINGIPTAPLLQPQAVRFDATRFNWIGSTNREPYVAFVWHTVPVTSIAELAAREVVVGATMPGTTMVDFPLLANDILGLKFRIVRGYESTPQINHAIERGEVEGMGGIGWSSVKAQSSHWINERKIRIIGQYGLKRHAELADVPTMLELARAMRMRKRCGCCSRAPNMAGPISCPRMCRRARAGAAPRLRRHHDGSGLHRRCRPAASQCGPDGEEVQALVAQLSPTRRRRSWRACGLRWRHGSGRFSRIAASNHD